MPTTLHVLLTWCCVLKHMSLLLLLLLWLPSTCLPQDTLCPTSQAGRAPVCQCSHAGSMVRLARRMSLALCWGHPGWDLGGKLARSRQ